MGTRPSVYLCSSKWTNVLWFAMDWENWSSYLVKWIIEVGYIWVFFVSCIVQYVGREDILEISLSWLGMFISGELKMTLVILFHFGLLQLFLEYLHSQDTNFQAYNNRISPISTLPDGKWVVTKNIHLFSKWIS